MKKISTKIISAIIVLMMLVNIIPIAIFAEELKSDEVMTVSASDGWGLPGDSVKINVNLENNPGIASMKIFVAYDEYLTLTAVEFDSDFGAYVTAPEPFANPQPLSYINPTSVTDAEGTFATLTFKIAENAPDNYNATIRITCDEENIFDENYDPVAVETKEGFVTVYHGIPGDMNSDLKVNNQDAILLFRHVAGWSVDIDPLALDFNGDNSVNNKDAISLFRYVAGWTEDFVPNYGEVHTHKLTYNEAKDATCIEDGNVSYYQCDECNKCYSDEAAKTEISSADIVIPTLGHDVVIDEALAPTYESAGLTEGSHCGVCGEVLKAQEEIPMLEADYYSVTYKNVKTATIPEGFDRYASHKGLASLPEISVPGYNFLGWFDGENKIEKINAGSKENVVLEARWEIITYTITYDCAGGENSTKNVFTYNIEDEITFSNATHKSYIFNGWVDDNGDFITRIPKGTSGNLNLTARWRAVRNVAHPINTIINPLYESYKFEHDGEKYVFIYYLGYIDNVPLDSSFTPYYFDARGTDTYECSTSEIHAEDITKSTNEATVETRGWQSEVKLSSETAIGNDKFATETITAEVAHNQSGSTTTTSEKGSSTTISDEFVNSVTKSRTWTTDDPAGWYRYINYATIDVFAVITYNALEDKYYISNVNAVRYIGQMWDYSAESSAFDDDINGALPFEIPTEFFDKILELTGNSAELGFITQEDGVECSIKGYIGTENDVIIPTYLDGKKVTSIASTVFAGNSSITSIIFGEGITYIPDGAFEGCTSLKSVVFNGKITEIGAKAFKGCTALEFEFSDTIVSIGDAAFEGCQAMNSVVISKNVTSFGAAVFDNCGELLLTVNSGDLKLIQATITSGATNLYIDWIYSEVAMNANCLLTVPAIQAFNFDGNLQTFNNLCIRSLAIDTTIEYTKIYNNTNECTLTCSSTNVNLRALSVESNKTALALSADVVNLSIGGTVALATKNGNDAVIANCLNISSASGEAATFNVTGGDGIRGGNGMTINGDLQINGFVTATVTGGSGTRNDKFGADGGIGISANNIILNTSSNMLITVIGGKGGDAYDCPIGENDGNGSNGKDGYAGGNGGVAISAENIVIESGMLNAQGGNGGEGGDGSECNWAAGKTVKGGRGGNGGHGAVAISALKFSITTSNIDTVQINLIGGNGGKTGKRGGCHENEHGAGLFEGGSATDGDYGTAGSGATAFYTNCIIEGYLDLIVYQNGENGVVDINLNEC